jgi:hypothetical protein
LPTTCFLPVVGLDILQERPCQIPRGHKAGLCRACSAVANLDQHRSRHFMLGFLAQSMELAALVEIATFRALSATRPGTWPNDREHHSDFLPVFFRRDWWPRRRR